ncbi:MAG TPA: biopolymer transporter ExbD [Opitutaceae bacterium]|nr:biopolymer transporter ExbD [Opitutaceae bacterium]
MIARPLDLASRLRPPPHGTGALHYVNVGLLGLFFSLFGSRFVLAPGLGVDFQLPQLPGARADAAQTSNYIINVLRSGQVFTEDGLVDLGQLRGWLKARAGRGSRPTLLIRASSGVTLSELVEIQGAAREAGFGRVLWGAEDPGADGGRADSK